MERKAQQTTLFEGPSPGNTVLKTTLHDLIEAISGELATHEQDYITPIILDLVSTGKSNLVVV
jgi:hypothetical protein